MDPDLYLNTWFGNHSDGLEFSILSFGNEYNTRRDPDLLGGLEFNCSHFSLLSHRIHSGYSNNMVLLIVVILVLTGYLGTGLLPAIPAIICIFILYAGRGIGTPIMLNFINERVGSEIRATVLSIRSLFIRLLQSLILIPLGEAMDVWSAQEAIMVMGIIYAVIFGIALTMLAVLKIL